MAKPTIKISGHKLTVDLSKTNVAEAVAALIKACTERQFPIGMSLDHDNGNSYLLARVRDGYGKLTARLFNMNTGIARNSRKVVTVQTDNADYPNGYVTDLPCEKDRFYDPDNNGEFIECDENGHVI